MGKGGKQQQEASLSKRVALNPKTSASFPAAKNLASSLPDKLLSSRNNSNGHISPAAEASSHHSLPPSSTLTLGGSSLHQTPNTYWTTLKKRGVLLKNSRKNAGSAESSIRKSIRSWLLKSVRSETPALVRFQQHYSSGFNDWVFTYIGIFGTHEAYLTLLPMLFFADADDGSEYNRHHFGRGLLMVLAAGVYITGLVKDYLCLPRPPSPPLIRMSTSSTTHLEYGFPSTHSANAVSVSLYCISYLAFYIWPSLEWTLTQWILQIGLASLLVLYGITVPISRIYTGMHSMTDVVGGTIVGALITVGYMIGLEPFERWLNGGVEVPVILFIISILSLWIYPDPHDACPCYDDSVCFASVVCGFLTGNWAVRALGHSYMALSNDEALAAISWSEWSRIAGLRMLVGVIAAIIWKIVSKPVFKAVYKTCGVPHERPHSPNGQFKLPKYTTDTFARFCSYFGVGYCVSLAMPLVFKTVGLVH
ncbi:hypothetical protein SmJEL517_g03331 [Synchytrium microbalum]|uniref:Phosphatidic acid phosphatase type 2/haloperoxidase domain-containing protein n=1 Tax=Synchytrium microbalum TaxID=1806994 RepID=A0A507C2D5_9FUNG|nr:uncharacterized protein SmJEL517_g03331 [Synchytrium microbalum]TPX33882.1 hypothetical protein SmJEL517_g03331 [Synchytrium microbalum]